MILCRSITPFIWLVALVSGLPSSYHQPAQHPLVRANDNFTLTPIRDALISNKVIGDVLDDFEPQFYLDVVYPKHDARVLLGNEIPVKVLKKRPRFSIRNIPSKNRPAVDMSSVKFTLALTDPDATSRYDPKWSEMCHWILTNITSSAHGDGSSEGTIEVDLEEDYAFPSNLYEEFLSMKHKLRSEECRRDGKGSKCLPGELASYFPPGPPAKTGWHRYVFVLLAGEGAYLHAPKARKHWGYGFPRHGVRDWALENRLEVVSANFFFAENERQ